LWDQNLYFLLNLYISLFHLAEHSNILFPGCRKGPWKSKNNVRSIYTETTGFP
jgi:hypothetical protein